MVALLSGAAPSFASICQRIEGVETSFFVVENGRQGPPALSPDLDPIALRFYSLNATDRRRSSPVLRVHLPALAAMLKDPDFRKRGCAAWLMGSLEPEEAVVWPLLGLLGRERHPAVLTQLILDLGAMKRLEIARVLRELFACENEGLRSMAYHVACQLPDPSMVDLVIRQWPHEQDVNVRYSMVQILGTLKDRRAVPIALATLSDRVPNVWLLKQVGSASELPALVAAFERHPEWPEDARNKAVDLIAEWAGDDAEPILDAAFQRETGQPRRLIAKLLLDRQLACKPEASDFPPCTPRDQVAAARLPFAREEVVRLLRDGNADYIGEIGWGRYHYGEYLTPLIEWSKSLDARERAALWQRVLGFLDKARSIAPGGLDPRVEPRRQLAFALASLASLECPANPDAAAAYLDQALAYADALRSQDPVVLRDVGRRVERLRQQWPDAGDDLPNLAGKYLRGSGGESHELLIDAAGTFTFRGQSDFIGPCTFGRWTMDGKWITETGRILLFPGPDTARWYPFDGPDVLFPVRSGHFSYLVAEEELPRFCQELEQGRPPHAYARTVSGNVSTAGNLPDECATLPRE